jgi:sterol desaturase/sphingolipid hydroxylase (fatty acid hydroxylase superfamily)
MSFEDAATYAIPVLFFLALALEPLIGGGRTFATVKHWRLIGVGAFLVSAACYTLMPYLFVPWLGAIHLVNLAPYGLWAAAPAVILTTFFTYWTHRIQHRFDILWRLGHQVHHAVARVDVASSAVFHPVEVAVQTAASVLAVGLLGLSADAAALAGFVGFFFAVFQHMNVRTPRWIGWVVQRPEAHCLHHERDVHARNFGDMTWWDMIFGTYENPETFSGEVGFEPGRAKRVLAMIAFVDVNQTMNRAKI